MVENTVNVVLQCMSNFGIGYMAGEVARALTPENANKAVKACIYVGGVAAGGAVAVKADAYIAHSVDQTAIFVKSVKENAKKKKAKKEEPIEATVEVVEEVVDSAEEVVEETVDKVFEEVKPKKTKKSMKN